MASLYLAFVLSGVAGLIYEVLWTRYLGLYVGTGANAQALASRRAWTDRPGTCEVDS